jgi:dolichyl-phosphate-mannose--protein O-mannosyl transferase
VPAFLLIGYLANLLPFIFIGRVMFLYHYLSALIFAIIILAYLIDQMKVSKAKTSVIIALIVLFGASFIFFSPLSYGLPMGTKQQNERFWFKSWM